MKRNIILILMALMLVSFASAEVIVIDDFNQPDGEITSASQNNVGYNYEQWDSYATCNFLSNQLHCAGNERIIEYYDFTDNSTINFDYNINAPTYIYFGYPDGTGTTYLVSMYFYDEDVTVRNQGNANSMVFPIALSTWLSLNLTIDETANQICVHVSEGSSNCIPLIGNVSSPMDMRIYETSGFTLYMDDLTMSCPGTCECTPLWVCDEYDVCDGAIRPCTSVVDTRCESTFLGDLSEYDIACEPITTTVLIDDFNSPNGAITTSSQNDQDYYYVANTCSYSSETMLCSGNDANPQGAQFDPILNQATLTFDYRCSSDHCHFVLKNSSSYMFEFSTNQLGGESGVNFGSGLPAVDTNWHVISLDLDFDADLINISVDGTPHGLGQYSTFNNNDMTLEDIFYSVYHQGGGESVYVDDLEITYCEPSWVCVEYDDCNSSGIEPCLSASDYNACGETFTGVLADYDANCTYVPPAASSGSYTSARKDVMYCVDDKCYESEADALLLISGQPAKTGNPLLDLWNWLKTQWKEGFP